jgi:tetratricopeptide (TPR) repeat protein
MIPLTNRISAGQTVIALTLAGLLLAGSVPASAKQTTSNKKSYTSDREEALSSFTQGVFLLERGAVRTALELLERAWEASDHDPVVGFKLAEGYSRAGKLDQSESVIDAVLEKDESVPDALLFKAKLYYLKGDRMNCAATLEKVVAQGPADFETQQFLGRVYHELEIDDKAIEAYAKALSLDPSYPSMHYRYGLLLRKKMKIDEAEKAFRDALELNPEFHEAALELAEIWIDQQRFAKAESLLTEIIEAEPENEEALLILSLMYFNQGKYDAGIRMLEERKRNAPLPREESILLGRLYYEAKEYDEALKVFSELYKQGSRTPDLARILGEISLKAGQTEQALRFYREAIRLDPDDYKSYLSLFFAAQKRFVPPEVNHVDLPDSEAQVLLSQASRVVRDGDFEGFYLVGLAYQNVDSLDAARTLLLRALELEPKNDRVLLSLASIEEKSENYGVAEKYLEILYREKPDDATINNFYGYLLAEQGKELDRAKQMIEKALEQDPTNGFYIDSLGWVYYQRGEYENALIEIEKASTLVESDPIILEHLGDVYRALKQYRNALAAYEKSQSLQEANDLLGDKIRMTRKGLE